MSAIPPTFSGPIGLRPHRGTTILVLGILALVLNFGCGIGWILGIIAWVMGNGDLKAMDAGQMDPAGRSNTNAGKICGMVSVILAVVGLIAYILMVLVFGVAIFAGAAGGTAAGGSTP